MVRYLKYIVLIFGSIGIMAASFFYLQNSNDIKIAWNNKTINYDYLKKHCLLKDGDYIYPCIKDEYQKFLKQVSLTGTSMGLKMVFNAMDEDKDRTTKFANETIKQLQYSINYVEINNLALDNAYRRYFGFQSLYGGFVASLKKYYEEGFEFSLNIILGLEGKDGIVKVQDPKERELLEKGLKAAKADFYRIKTEVEAFLDKEMTRLKIEQL